MEISRLKLLNIGDVPNIIKVLNDPPEIIEVYYCHSDMFPLLEYLTKRAGARGKIVVFNDRYSVRYPS